MGTTVAGWLNQAAAGLGDVLFSPAFLAGVATRALGIVAILVGVRIALRVLNAVVERAFALDRLARRYAPGIGHSAQRRQKTLLALTKSVVRYTLYFVAGVMLLQQLGLNTASILAAAGIGGLAVGFGAQNLVKDVISGFFIIFEDQFAVGDEVSIGNYNGIVEEMGIRSTKVRGFGGELFIIPNGQIAEVTNFTGGSMRVMFDVGIAYEADVDKALRVLADACQEAARTIPGIVEGPEVLGVQDLADSSVNVRILARATGERRWAVERDLKLAVKKCLDAEGVEIPYPHRTLLVRAWPPGVPPGVEETKPQ